MSPEQLFSIVNLVAVVSWLALAALPRMPWVARRVTGVVVPGLLSLVYVGLLVSSWGAPGDFSSLGGVSQLFANPWLLLAGWTHYLAFDLLVGSWQAQDARARGIRHVLLLPCLLLTFLFGPAGWLLYQAVRYASPTPGRAAPRAM
ncbi:MAG: ABA4-like family protein [Vicinamibacterales bacterium]